MDYLKGIMMSASGMSAQRRRMNVISSNLANANSTQTAEGGPYRRREVVFAAEPLEKSFRGALENAMDDKLSTVRITRVQEDNAPFRLVYNPSHPHADANGYVRMPNVNLIQEMADMIDASRSYEANLTILNTTKNMALKDLDLAR